MKRNFSFAPCGNRNGTNNNNNSADAQQRKLTPEIISQYYTHLYPIDLLNCVMSLQNNLSLGVVQKKDEPSRRGASRHPNRRPQAITSISHPPNVDAPMDWNRQLDFEALKKCLKETRNVLRIDWGCRLSRGIHYSQVDPIEELIVPHVTRNDVIMIDVDLTDFETMRDMCPCGLAKEKICHVCWNIAKSAMKVLEYLSWIMEFPREKCLFVFSGGRGFHYWVFDVKSAERKAFIEAVCSVGRVSDDDFDSFSDKFKNHTKNRIYERFIVPYFEKFIAQSSKKIASEGSPRADDDDDDEPLDARVSDDRRPFTLQYIASHFAIKIDKKVSESTHLLKSPFSLHLKTGMVSVPIFHQEIDTFDFSSVPCVLKNNNTMKEFASEVKIWIEKFSQYHLQNHHRRSHICNAAAAAAATMVD